MVEGKGGGYVPLVARRRVCITASRAVSKSVVLRLADERAVERVTSSTICSGVRPIMFSVVITASLNAARC